MFSERKELFKNLEKLHYRFKHIYIRNEIYMTLSYCLYSRRIEYQSMHPGMHAMAWICMTIIFRIRMQINLFCIGCCRYVMQKMEKNGI